MIKSAFERSRSIAPGIVLLVAATGPALAHDPIFGLGPHTLFAGAVEVAIELGDEKRGDDREFELGLELAYGLTGDWSVGVELPFVRHEEGSASADGVADVEFFTKFRFWREDALGLQRSAAISLRVNADNGDDDSDPPLGNGAVDTAIGLTYGYESLKWYRWASLRYQRPGENSAGLRGGERYLFDFVVGWRSRPPRYREPDTVWLLELNGELAGRSELDGENLADTGGDEWFVAPGIFWTSRNFAIKAGLQLPLASDLNGNQVDADYRLSTTFEWHL